VLPTGNQSLDGGGALAAEQPIGVLPLRQLHHRSAEPPSHQLGLQLLKQLLRRRLTGSVPIEGNEQMLHPLAL
jgi:hypothetical protein